MAKSREQNIDVLRGIAIFLVVLGHAIVKAYPERFNENLLFRFCYSFHMPLMIFIGGYLTGHKASGKIDFSWLKRQAYRLMLPYAIWTIIELVRRQSPIEEYPSALLWKPIYWFLINHFVCAFVIFLSLRFAKRKYGVRFSLNAMILYCLFIGLYAVYRDNNTVVKNMVMFFPFYISGIYIYIYMRDIRNIRNYPYISLLLYPLSMLLYRYKQMDIFVPIVAEKLPFEAPYKIIKAAMLFYNHYIVAPLGIMFMWCVIRLLFRTDFPQTKLRAALEYLGTHSLEIYVMHSMFFVCFTRNAFLNSAFSVATGTITPLLISRLIQKSAFLNRCLFGHESIDAEASLEIEEIT